MSAFRRSRVNPARSASCCFHNFLGTPRALHAVHAEHVERESGHKLAARHETDVRSECGFHSECRKVSAKASHGTQPCVAMAAEKAAWEWRSQSLVFCGPRRANLATADSRSRADHPAAGSRARLPNGENVRGRVPLAANQGPCSRVRRRLAPGTSPRDARTLAPVTQYSVTNRYPIPTSVRICFGWVGFASSFCRSCRTKMRR